MILIKPSYEIQSNYNNLDLIERAGRVCYKSDIPDDIEKRNKFIASRIRDAHESVLEHSMLTVKFICDRGVSHELVRHRLCAFSQESTRYCNYSGGVTFIIPPWVDIEPGIYPREDAYSITYTDDFWLDSLYAAEARYKELLHCGWTPQQARSVLPNATKTELFMTANYREWRHILKLRIEKAAHPQMRELMQPLLIELKENIPVIFDDIPIPNPLHQDTPEEFQAS